MTVPLKRVPPPPPIAVNDPAFNRWLHDLTAFITEGGGIDPGVIPGYDLLVSTVANHTTQIASHTVDIASLTSAVGVHTSEIATLFSTTATHTSQIATNTTNIAANTTDIATNTADIITLNTRSQVLHGVIAPVAGTGIDGDWYSDTTAKHIYVKVGGSWTLIV
jgi:hypothetical protein